MSSLIPNPWILLAFVLVLGGASAYTYTLGAKNKENEITAQLAKDEALEQRVSDAAQEGAARAISKIRINNVTHQQKLEKEIIHVPDYSQCMHSDDGLRAVNDALQNKSESSDIRGVPGEASAIDR